MRSLIVAAARFAAMPFRSDPEDAAVGVVLGTMSVFVAVILTLSKSMPNSSATTCATLVWRPCPISVPPWFTSTEPSV